MDIRGAGFSTAPLTVPGRLPSRQLWPPPPVTRITRAGSRSDPRLPANAQPRRQRGEHALRPGPGWLVRCRRPAAMLKALGSLAEADSIGGYEPAAEYQALRGSIRRSTACAAPDSRNVRVATAPILVSFPARCRPPDRGNDRWFPAGQPTAIRMCGVSAGFSHPSTASSSALGRATQPSVYPSGMSSWRKMPAPLSGGWGILMSMKCW
jgi:hypothetical protein